MRQTFLLERVGDETRLAVIEDDRLCELYIHRPGSDDAAGSVWLGRVENNVPGLNAAFVDIGAEKKGFLDAGDAPDGRLPRPGQAVMVQVSKVQSGQKGHRLTGRVTLPGRALALLPGQRSAGVSKKIANPDERERLRNIAAALTEGSDMGVILRTASAGMPEAALRREYAALVEQWRRIEQRAAHAMPPAPLFDNDSLPLRVARDMLTDDVDAVWVEGEALFDEVGGWIDLYVPEKAGLLKRHDGATPLYDLYRVDSQLEKALRKYVWLKSGGSLVIEETEAMTVIDVNTGKFTGAGNLEDTIFRINCEAAEEIARQLRLRNIGGIVIVDFIDMADAGRNEALLDRLRELAKADRSRLTVVGMTGLGLVELTRKKARRPLSKQLMHVCPACGGDGVAPSHETVARRAARDIWRRRRAGGEGALLIEAEGGVIARLKALNAPEGVAVYLKTSRAQSGAYEISPADAAHPPEGTQRWK